MYFSFTHWHTCTALYYCVIIIVTFLLNIPRLLYIHVFIWQLPPTIRWIIEPIVALIHSTFQHWNVIGAIIWLRNVIFSVCADIWLTCTPPFPLRLRKRNVETPYTVHISLLEGHVSPSQGQITKLASLIAERWYMAPGVRRIEIHQNGVVGTLFLPPGEHSVHWPSNYNPLRDALWTCTYIL